MLILLLHYQPLIKLVYLFVSLKYTTSFQIQLKNKASGLEQFSGHINPECKKSIQYDEPSFSLYLCFNLTKLNILTYKLGILFCCARMRFYDN